MILSVLRKEILVCSFTNIQKLTCFIPFVLFVKQEDGSEDIFSFIWWGKVVFFLYVDMSFYSEWGLQLLWTQSYFNYCVVSLESNHLHLAYKRTMVSSLWQVFIKYFLEESKCACTFVFQLSNSIPLPPSWALGPSTSFYVPSSCSLSLLIVALLAGLAFHEGPSQWYHIAVHICLKLAERWRFGSLMSASVL